MTAAAGPDHPRYFGRIDRIVAGRVFAVLALAAMFGFPTLAYAETEIWSATLTVGQYSDRGFVTRGYDKGHSSGRLNVKWFQHKGVTYTILNLTHAVDGPLSLVTNVTGANALGNNNSGLVLDIGNTGFFLEKHQFGHGTIHLWNDPGIDLERRRRDFGAAARRR